MKPFLPFLAVVAFLVGSVHPCTADNNREAKPRFKGVELYSWKNDSGEWVFVLVDGTNAEKSEQLVKGDQSLLPGVAALKQAFLILAEGEQVSWSHRIAGFEYPPKATRDAIAVAAKNAKIILRSSAE